MAETLDQARAEEFGGRMVGLVNDATLALLVSVGHRTGLYDQMATMAPSTSEEIAGATGLNERYVREWLGAMTVGGIVQYDPGAKQYSLPPEHAASLTRAAGDGNLASYAQVVAMMGQVEDGIVECFRNGGGLGYEHFPAFVQLMSEMSAQVFDHTLIDVTLPVVDGLVDRLNEGIDVADVGCGAGHAVCLMAEAFPNSRFTGIDFSEEAVAAGKQEAADKGLVNADFVVGDAAGLDMDATFDFVTAFDSVHDQARPDLMLAGIARALRDDGVFLCVDIGADSEVANNVDHPLGPFIYSVSTMHCMTVSLAHDGMGLGTAWGEQKAREMLADAGFTSIDVKQVEGDILNNYYVARKG